MSMPILTPEITRAAIRETMRSGRSLSAVCLQCGATVIATIGGTLPPDAILAAGGGQYAYEGEVGTRHGHRPEVWARGKRIR